jgi:cellobiose-specific phosphotransferase system component IIB
MKILFTCMGGMSSSLLAKKYYDYIKRKEPKFIFLNYPQYSELSKTEHFIAYMHVQGVTIEERDKYDGLDLILVAPQSSYLIPKMIKESKLKGLKVHHIIKIPPTIYGRHNMESLHTFIMEKIIIKEVSND